MFETVDKVLYPWSEKYGLHISTSAKEVEVRKITVVDDAGTVYDLWIESENENVVIVGISQMKPKKQRRIDFLEAPPSDLESLLDNAYSQIEEWIKQNGHTRTPVLNK